MKLYKDNTEKEIKSQKVIDRLLKSGWVLEGENDDKNVEEPEEIQPKKRGRPSKKESN